MTLIGEKSERFLWLQVGRYLAAFWVLLYHGENQLFISSSFEEFSPKTFGFLGVDFFFCLSGFIIFWSSRKHIGKVDKTGAFILKRIARIFPLLWILMLFQISIYYLTGYGTLDNSLSALIEDFFLLPVVDREHVVNVAWTLRYEMFFYILFSILMLFRRSLFNYLLIFWLLLISLNLIFGESDAKNIGVIHYLISPWNYLFLSGIAVGYLKSYDFYSLSKSLIAFCLLSSGLTIFYFYGFPSGHEISDTSRFIASSLFFGGVITLLIDIEGRFRAPPKILVLLGNASYSMYLIHSTILFAVHKFIPDSIFHSWMAVLFIHLISILSYIFFERKATKIFTKYLTKTV